MFPSTQHTKHNVLCDETKAWYIYETHSFFLRNEMRTMVKGQTTWQAGCINIICTLCSDFSSIIGNVSNVFLARTQRNLLVHLCVIMEFWHPHIPQNILGRLFNKFWQMKIILLILQAFQNPYLLVLTNRMLFKISEKERNTYLPNKTSISLLPLQKAFAFMGPPQ